jgi:hypothetical protein
MIDHTLFLENMGRNPNFLKFAISSSLDMVNENPKTAPASYLYRAFDTTVSYWWDPDPFIKVDFGEIFSDKVNFEEARTICSTYVYWAYRAGYLAEAAQCAQALKQLDLWEEYSDPD